MQSDGNSFSGDVVLDSFNMAYRDEDSSLDQKYKKQISPLRDSAQSKYSSYMDHVLVFYSVMQSDGESFHEYVVYDSFNMTYRDLHFAASLIDVYFI